MTTTDPSSGTNAPRDTHVTTGTGDATCRRVVAGAGLAHGSGSATAKARAFLRYLDPFIPDVDERNLLREALTRFQALEAHELHLIAEGVLSAKPSAGNPALSQEQLKALAQYVRDERERERQEEEKQRTIERLREEKRQDRTWSWIRDGASFVLGIITTVLGFWLKSLFLPSS